MAKDGLQGAIRGKKRAADLVERKFSASAPNRLWVADFTHVATWSGVC
jgi:putative transposase